MEILDFEAFQKVFAIYMHLFPSKTWTDEVIAKYYEKFVSIECTLEELDALVDYFFNSEVEFAPRPVVLLDWIKQRRSPASFTPQNLRDGEEVPLAGGMPPEIKAKLQKLMQERSATQEGGHGSEN